LDIPVDLPEGGSHAKTEVVALTELVNEPTHAGERVGVRGLVALHVLLGMQESAGLGDHAPQSRSRILGETVRDVLSRGHLPGALRTLLSWLGWVGHGIHSLYLPLKRKASQKM
jgi:hypothetical protein